jgi:signal transduction histidine kinase
MMQQRGSVIELRTEVAEHLPAITGVESEIREALTNLIFNSVDAMPEGGTLTLRTAVSDAAAGASSDAEGQSAGSNVLLEVSDTGVGMDCRSQVATVMALGSGPWALVGSEALARALPTQCPGPSNPAPS